MRNLKFKVDAQALSTDEDLSELVPGTEGYLAASFEFTDEWNGCMKIASFFDRLGNEYAERLIHDRCIIPKFVLDEQTFKVQVIGVKTSYKILTNKLRIKQGR